MEKKNEKVVQKLRGKKEKGVATDAAESQKASLFFSVQSASLPGWAATMFQNFKDYPD